MKLGRKMVRFSNAAGIGVLNAFLRWATEDLLFAVLPLIIVLAIGGLLQESAESVWALKEWSFANIVIFGVLIRKAAFRRSAALTEADALSPEAMIMLPVVLLILASLLLGLVLVGEHYFFRPPVVASLGGLQVALFVVAAYLLLMRTAREEDDKRWPLKWIFGRSRDAFFEGAQRDLSVALAALAHLHKAMEEEEQVNSERPDDVATLVTQIERLEAMQMRATLDAIERATEDIRRRIGGSRAGASSPAGET